MMYATTCPSPVGTITLACDGDGKNLVGLWTHGQKYHGDTIFKTMTPNDGVPLFDAAKRWLKSYFAGENPAVSALPLKPAGSEFRQGVWALLREIPYGEVVTYGCIAKRMAERMGRKSMSSRAVGGAIGHNPISIIIPCHRVMGAGGSLTGYAGGIEMKKRLLELEGANMAGSYV